MRGPASVWLTSDPAAPDVRVPVEMTSLDAPEVCSLAIVRQGSMDDPAMQHDEPAVLITNSGGGQGSGR